MPTVLVLAFVLISVVAIAIAVVDAVRFVQRTGTQMPTALTYRSYLA
jgi:hypothetical protein